MSRFRTARAQAPNQPDALTYEKFLIPRSDCLNLSEVPPEVFLGEVLPEFVMDGRPETRQVGQVSSSGGPASVSFFEPEVESATARRTLAAVERVASAIVARWRAIILLFILVSSIWLALQAFLLVRSAFSYLADNLPKLSELRKQLQSNRISPKGSVTISPSPITNCWRNRSLGSNCFKQGTAGRKSHQPAFESPDICFRHAFETADQSISDPFVIGRQIDCEQRQRHGPLAVPTANAN